MLSKLLFFPLWFLSKISFQQSQPDFMRLFHFLADLLALAQQFCGGFSGWAHMICAPIAGVEMREGCVPQPSHTLGSKSVKSSPQPYCLRH